MADDYYGDMGEEAAPDKGADDSHKEDDYAGETALIPKSLLGGKKFGVGEEVMFKIEHEYEDQVEISYAKGDKGKDDKPTMSKADDMMDSMAAKNMEG